MISLIPNLPDHVVGVRANGEVTKEDLEQVLMPALAGLVARKDGIHYLLVLDGDVKNWDIGAWLADLEIGMKYLSKWHKIAVVSEEQSVKTITALFDKVVPGESRGYTHAQLPDAIAWVSEHDAKDHQAGT